MSYKVVLLPEAVQDLEKSINWYNEQKNGLGKLFYTEIKNKIESLKLSPLQYGIVYKSTRCVLINKFPFRIHFEINAQKEELIVLGIIHTSRSPSSWMKRT